MAADDRSHSGPSAVPAVVNTVQVRNGYDTGGIAKQVKHKHIDSENLDIVVWRWLSISNCRVCGINHTQYHGRLPRLRLVRPHLAIIHCIFLAYKYPPETISRCR